MDNVRQEDIKFCLFQRYGPFRNPEVKIMTVDHFITVRSALPYIALKL